MSPAAARRSALIGLALLLVLPARPAAADAPRPTDFRSEVLTIRPAPPDGVEAQVVGGDSFLELRIPRGTTAEVPDYEEGDEEPAPYLRFRADGIVQRNRRAVASTANESRYGASTGSPDASADPVWETVATNGTYAWHDHRIHWMAPSRPTPIAGTDRIDLGGTDGTWTVPVVIDGTPTTIVGALTVQPDPSPIVWIVPIIGAWLAVTVLGSRVGRRAALIASAVVALATVAVSWGTWSAAPAGSGATALPIVVTAVGTIAAVLAAFGPKRWRPVTIAATAAALLGWGFTRVTVLVHAELPTTLPFWFDRTITAAALGTGMGLVLLLARRPVRASQTA